MSDEDTAAGFAAGAGELLGEAFEVGGPVGLAVGVAGAAGAAIGTGIDDLSGGAISDGIATGLGDLVGPDQSYQAAQSFDDGDYLGTASHMAQGAWDTVSTGAEHLADSAVNEAGELWDDASSYL